MPLHTGLVLLGVLIACLHVHVVGHEPQYTTPRAEAFTPAYVEPDLDSEPRQPEPEPEPDTRVVRGLPEPEPEPDTRVVLGFAAEEASQSHTKKSKSRTCGQMRDVFLQSDPSTFGAVGPDQNTSRSQHKEV